MKIALCSSFVPFVLGGLRNIVDWLKIQLEEQGHQVEILYIPQKDRSDLLIGQYASNRLIDLANSADRIICFRPFSYAIPHPHKIVWFIHHLRDFYDLWNDQNRGYPHSPTLLDLRDTLRKLDTAALSEATALYTNSRIVGERLKFFNGLNSEVLYPPIHRPDRFFCRDQNDEIVYVCRVEDHKRQHLLIEAMRHTKTPVRLRLCGRSGEKNYTQKLNNLISQNQLHQRVSFENCWISEEEKSTILADCLAAAYLPLDEDSYGYPTLEAAHSEKPIITTWDAGGVLEFVQNGRNGFIVPPDPIDLATVMDQLYRKKQSAKTMGKEALIRIDELNISWTHVLQRLLK